MFVIVQHLYQKMNVIEMFVLMEVFVMILGLELFVNVEMQHLLDLDVREILEVC